MKIRLVKNWNKAWTWLSVIIPALNAAFLGSWMALPGKLQDSLPLPWIIAIAIVLLVLGVLGRLVDQGGDDNGDASK